MRRHARSVIIPEYSNSHETAQEANLFRTFSTLATSGSPDRRWGEVALATQVVMDACARSAREGRPVSLGSSANGEDGP
jgi:predicted dehydrogenase